MGHFRQFGRFGRRASVRQHGIRANTYKPECLHTGRLQQEGDDPPEGGPPYKIAFVNGYAGNDWRTTAIQSAKAWAARPENKAKLGEFKVVSVGNDFGGPDRRHR